MTTTHTPNGSTLTEPAEAPDAPHLVGRTEADATAPSTDRPKRSGRPGGAAAAARRMVKRGCLRATIAWG